MSIDQHAVCSPFSSVSAIPRWIVRAPGRVNLINELRLQRRLCPPRPSSGGLDCARTRDDRRVVCPFVGLQRDERILMNHRQGNPLVEYLKGVAWSLSQAGHKAGKACVAYSAGRGFPPRRLWSWPRRAFARKRPCLNSRWPNSARSGKPMGGVNCGIMDQLISAAVRLPMHVDRLPLAGHRAVPFGGDCGRSSRHGDASRSGRFRLQRSPRLIKRPPSFRRRALRREPRRSNAAGGAGRADPQPGPARDGEPSYEAAAGR